MTRRNRLGTLGTAILFVGLTAQTRSEPVSKPVVFTHVTVIDATGRRPAEDMTVIIEGGRIAAIERAVRASVHKDAEVINASGKFLIPGLWNMHVHSVSYEEGKKALTTVLANGITGVRDMGAPLEDSLRLRKETSEGKLLGPHMVVAGPLLQGPLPPKLAQMSLLRSVKDEAEARQAVISLKVSGVDFIKVSDSVTRDSYFAIASEARGQGIPFAGHIPPAVSAWEASDAGQKSVEHLGGTHYGVLIACSKHESRLESKLREMMKAEINAVFQGKDPDDSALFRAALTNELLASYDDETAASLFHRFAANGTWQVPTLVTLRGLWDRKSLSAEDVRYGNLIKQKELEAVNAMRRAGVRVCAGTDGPLPQAAPNLHEELALLVQAGFTPMQALQAASRDAAEFLGRLDEFGTVERGKAADLVLLDGNPLEDIHNTRRIAAVVVGGEVLTKATLLKMQGAAKP